MKFNKLGNTNLSVSSICLGTMTWGTQNSEKDAFEQMDYSVDQGINFFDTAELYAIPPNKKTYGKTEEIIGNWFKQKKNRKKKKKSINKKLELSKIRTYHIESKPGVKILDEELEFKVSVSLSSNRSASDISFMRTLSS